MIARRMFAFTVIAVRRIFVAAPLKAANRR